MVRSRPKWRWWTNLLVVLGSLVVSLAIIEAGLRLYGIEATGPRSLTRLAINEFHPVLGWWPRKHERYFRSSGYYAHFNYYNLDRMPVVKDAFDRTPDPEVPSIALIGDSFVEGYYVPYEKSFANLIDEAFPKRQLLNLGVSGYSPGQYLLRARMQIPSYNVTDIIVFFFGFNDARSVNQGTYQGYAKPLFGEALDRPINVPLQRLRGGGEQPSVVQRIAWNLAIYSVLRPLYRKYVSPPATHGLSEKAFFLKAEEVAKSVRLMAAIRDVAPAARFHIVYLPVYHEVLNADALAQNLALFFQYCGVEGVSCQVPALDALAAETLAQQYIGDQAQEGHFSEEGSARIADFSIGLLRGR